jgi:hypothetical protein
MKRGQVKGLNKEYNNIFLSPKPKLCFMKYILSSKKEQIPK